MRSHDSIALLEAMRAAKPIIATDVGRNTKSVRDKKEALIVKSASVPALRDALDEMISNHELRSQLATAVRERFDQEFTEDTMVAKTAEWMNTFLNVPSSAQ